MGNSGLKRFLKYGLLGLLVVLLLVLTIASWYMLDFSLKPAYNKGRDIQASLDYLRREYPFTIEWIDSLQEHKALRDTFIMTDDGRRLHALYVLAPHPTAKTALLLHGYTDNATRMLHVGYIYHHHLGYNLLLPDFHAHGESDGEAIRMGWKDHKDALLWSELADELFHVKTRQVVHGISMGGFVTMVLAGEAAPQLQAFVDDCGYTSVWEEFAHELKASFGLSEFPLMFSTSLLCKLRYGWTFGEADAVKILRQSQKPMLFIHGDHDNFVPTEMVHTLYEAKPAPKELWLTPDVGHARSYYTYPDEYIDRIKSFCHRYLP